MMSWCPFKAKGKFKILLLTYKTLNGQAPSYLKSLIVQYCPSRVSLVSDVRVSCGFWTFQKKNGRHNLQLPSAPRSYLGQIPSINPQNLPFLIKLLVRGPFLCCRGTFLGEPSTFLALLYMYVYMYI